MRGSVSWGLHSRPRLLRLEGELDLSRVEELTTALADAEDSGDALTIDLAGLDFIDCAALSRPFRLAGRMSRGGRRLVFEGDRGQVARLLDLTGLSAEVERLEDGPRLGLASGPWARSSPAPSRSPEGVRHAA